ncbi:hypothetical protein [Aureimonas psammosilenae]|nr:hypothetical protein [Aureimonas psammosilenae]
MAGLPATAEVAGEAGWGAAAGHGAAAGASGLKPSKEYGRLVLSN